jgi:hypothetical protein
VYIRCGERGCGGRRGEGKGMVGACAGRDAPPRAGESGTARWFASRRGRMDLFFLFLQRGKERVGEGNEESTGECWAGPDES